VLAVVQPGDLGDEETAGPAQETTTTTTEADLTTTTTIAVSTTEPSTTETTAGGGATTTTTAPGSGLGEDTPPSGGTDGVADTGGESMLGAGMALGALGLLLRRATAARLG
jgi:hypothetical protein